MTTILAFISLIVAFIGIFTVCWNSIPDSISAMVYSLKSGKQWLWSVWLFIVSILLMPQLLELTEGIGWLTIVSLIGVAVTPLINEEMQKVHNFLGISAGILSQICVALICPWWLFLWVLILYAFALNFINHEFDDEYEKLYGKSILIIEIMCMITTYCSIFFNKYI